MRTVVFLFILFFGFSSCDYDNFFNNKVGPGVNKTVIDTFTFSCVNPVLEGRHGCNGEFLPEPKVTGWQTKENTLNQYVPCFFTDRDLKDAGYVYAGKDPLYTEGMGPFWDLLGWIFLIILGILLLWLLLWLLRELFNWLTSQRVPNNNQVVQQPGPVAVHQENPIGTWVPEGYALIPNNMVVIPVNGIYLGIRREKEVLMTEIIPQNQTSQTTEETPGPPKNAEEIPPATTM